MLPKKKELKEEVNVTLANFLEFPRAEPSATKAHELIDYELVSYEPSQLQLEFIIPNIILTLKKGKKNRRKEEVNVTRALVLVIVPNIS